MPETPISLLDRLRQQSSDSDSWQRLVDLYTPLIQRWLGSYFLQPADVNDVVQQVLTVLVQKLPTYQRANHPGAFRAWLRTITLNHLRSHWRSRKADLTTQTSGAEALDELENPASDLNRVWDQQHDSFVARRLLELIESEFNPKARLAFCGLVLENRTAREVAAELQLSVNAVYIAKSRVLHRLRQEIQGLID